MRTLVPVPPASHSPALLVSGTAALGLHRSTTSWWPILAAALQGTHLILAILYSLLVPAWEAPDEVAHFDFVAHLLRERALPVMQEGKLDQSYHPPLSYILAALVVAPAGVDDPSGAFRLNQQFQWAGNGGTQVTAALHGDPSETFPYRGQVRALHLARAASVAMSVGTVALTMLLGRLAVPGRPEIALLAGTLVAFNPQFLFIGGALNNDNLVTLVSTAGWVQLLRVFRAPESWRDWALLGALAGTALLAKQTGVPLIIVSTLVLAWIALRARSATPFARNAAALLASAFLVAGWWYIRNTLLYGDPLAFEAYSRIFAVHIRPLPLEWSEIPLFFNVQLRSFWGVFGWMNVQPRERYHLVARALCASGALGLALALLPGQRRFGGPSIQRWSVTALALLAFVALTQEAYQLAILTRCNASCYQGRYVFPVIGPIAVLLAAGLMAFVPTPARRLASGMALLAGASGATYVLARVILPAYGAGV